MMLTWLISICTNPWAGINPSGSWWGISRARAQDGSSIPAPNLLLQLAFGMPQPAPILLCNNLELPSALIYKFYRRVRFHLAHAFHRQDE